MIFDLITRPSSMTAAAVSSHELSIPRTNIRSHSTRRLTRLEGSRAHDCFELVFRTSDFPFAIFHLPFSILNSSSVAQGDRHDSSSENKMKWKMANGKWKMENVKSATLRTHPPSPDALRRSSIRAV